MSATGRSDVREKDDFYATPDWCTRAILAGLKPGSVCDPCCGNGAILDVVKRVWLKPTTGVEIDHDRAQAARANGHEIAQYDALTAPWPEADLIITNPPYRLAIDFISRAMARAKNGDVAFLLRLNFLGSQKRTAFHRGYPADVYVLPRRPSFTNGGTDATEYAWFVWGPGRGNRWWSLEYEAGPRAKVEDPRQMRFA